MSNSRESGNIKYVPLSEAQQKVDRKTNYEQVKANITSAVDELNELDGQMFSIREGEEKHYRGSGSTRELFVLYKGVDLVSFNIASLASMGGGILVGLSALTQEQAVNEILNALVQRDLDQAARLRQLKAEKAALSKASNEGEQPDESRE